MIRKYLITFDTDFNDKCQLLIEDKFSMVEPLKDNGMNNSMEKKRRIPTIGMNESIEIGKNNVSFQVKNDSIEIGKNNVSFQVKNESIEMGKNNISTQVKNESIEMGKNNVSTQVKNESIEMGKNNISIQVNNESMEMGKNNVSTQVNNESITTKNNEIKQETNTKGFTVSTIPQEFIESNKHLFTSYIVEENAFSSLSYFNLTDFPYVQFVSFRMNSLKNANIVISNLPSLEVLIAENCCCTDTNSLSLSSIPFYSHYNDLDLPSLQKFICGDFAFHETLELTLSSIFIIEEELMNRSSIIKLSIFW